MASFERLDSGLYRGIYYVNGQKRRTHAPHFEFARDALEAAEELAVKARRQAAAQAGTLSARITWAQWWETIAPDREFDSDNAVTEALIVKTYLLPRWGEEPLNEIESDHVRQWVLDLERGRAPRDAADRYPAQRLSPSYVRRIYNVFGASIREALDKKILSASPCVGVKLPKVQRRVKVYATTEDMETLGEELREDYKDGGDFLLETGLRPGELAGMHSHRIDRKKKVLYVAETYVYKAKQIRGWPKGKKVRQVPLSTKALEIVDRRLDGRDLNASCGVEHMHGEKCTHPLVFLTKLGRVMRRDMLRHAFKTAAEKVGVDPKSPYAWRRGTATRLAEGGLDVFVMADMMGWEDINLAQEYVQQTATANARVLAALGDRGPLTVVEDLGQPGTSPGTRPGSQKPSAVPKRRGKNTG